MGPAASMTDEDHTGDALGLVLTVVFIAAAVAACLG
jgi:hypothetical protein